MKLRRNEFHYIFSGNGICRDKFLAQFKKELIEFLGGDDNFKGNERTFVMMMREISKNIWDHARGNGEAVFSLRGGKIFFEIKDHGKECHNFEILKNSESSKAGNGVNWGVGLMLIENFAKGINVEDFKIDCSCGFRYTGVCAPE